MSNNLFDIKLGFVRGGLIQVDDYTISPDISKLRQLDLVDLNKLREDLLDVLNEVNQAISEMEKVKSY